MTADKQSAEVSKKHDEIGLQNPRLKDVVIQEGFQKRGSEPDWANGLRQLYDSVVDEPLPDSFKDLLSQLDDKSS